MRYAVFEACLWLLGGALVGHTLVQHVQAVHAERAARAEVTRALAGAAARERAAPRAAAHVSALDLADDVPAPDMSDWSAHRIERYAEDAGAEPAALGVLRIPALDLEVVVLREATPAALDVGAAIIAGTPLPAAGGNTGIAAHRDGYFRALRHIENGDRIELETVRGRFEYVVRATSVVAPDAVEVLAPREQPLLTLVTCHPFYFVGPAPRRFIVHAERRVADRYDSGLAYQLHDKGSP
ncbi:MAG: class D sortase [Gammaproteobacteria bacterium]